MLRGSKTFSAHSANPQRSLRLKAFDRRDRKERPRRPQRNARIQKQPLHRWRVSRSPNYNAFPAFKGVLVIRSVVRRYLIFFFLSALAVAQTAEQRTVRYLDSVRNQPSLLLAFLHDLPKGGDLHNHLDGAIYAEDLIDFAANDNFCVDRTTSRLMDA